jgi:hypothetical protein
MYIEIIVCSTQAKEFQMTKLKLEIDIKIAIFIGLLIAVIALGMRVKVVNATSLGSMSGTYACLQNRNFGGHVTTKTGGDSAINFLMILTFTQGSSNVTVKGIVNKVTNFEKSNAATTTTIMDSGSTQTYEATTIGNVFKLKDTTNPENGTSYFAVVNSGNTLMMLSAPTSTSTDNGICQLM